jgi:hypothetical protein
VNPPLYLFFTKPRPLATVVPLLLPLVGRFTLAAGHSFFGDLFLRDPATGEYAVLVAATLELEETGEVDEDGLRGQILANPEVVRRLLRPEEAAALVQRLGTLGAGEAFFPVPLPAFGGSGDLATFQPGGLWEYLAIVAQSVGG